jgi:carboxyl-terminal processing protease
MFRSTIAWLISGCLVSTVAFASGQVPDFRAGYGDVLKGISETMLAHHYDPALLKSSAYLETEAKVSDLASRAASREEFVEGFNRIWQSGPFSHVRLNVARQSAEAMANYLDSMRIGGGGAQLSWQDNIATVTVNTMMGLDTIEEIDAAYLEIAKRDTQALIIDLRANEGGAFAVRPLVEHLISEPLDAGAFVSRDFAAKSKGPPKISDVQSLPSWQGWSIKAFWADVESQPITRIRFMPSTPRFAGPVYVLISGRTASAAELATDALAAGGRAVLIGERTAGQMLSQKMYDLPLGLQLSLPIADYYAFHSGHIEGTGIAPDVVSPATEAMDVAHKLIANAKR